jgi:hypothetical protein
MGAFEVDWCVGIKDLRSSEVGLSIRINPNPFNSKTTLEIELETPGVLEITIFNHFGQAVDHFVHEGWKGLNRIPWHAGSLPAGVYVCRVRAVGRTASIKMVIL